jgi:hypothetical protein
MTTSDRRALAAALRHGRTRYAFRATWYRGRRDYHWYPAPLTGREPPVLRVTDLGEGVWLLAFGFGKGSSTVDSVGFALSVLAFFGVYQPAPEGDEGCCPPDGYCAWHREQLDLYSAAEVTP